MPTPPRPPAQKAVPNGRPQTPPADRFGQVLAHLFVAEGGYNNIKGDRGGATNFGISLRFAAAEARLDPAVRRALDVDLDGDVDGEDIRALTPDRAAAVYRRCFWDRLRCDDLPPPIDGAVFDQAVNGGLVAAIKMLQQAINITRGFPDVIVDGRIGRETVLGARNAEPGKLLFNFRRLVEQRYKAIAAADPSQGKFLRGWLNRAANLGRA